MRTKPFSPPPVLVIALATVAGMLSTSLVASLTESLVAPHGTHTTVPTAALPAVEPNSRPTLQRAAGDDRLPNATVVTSG